MISKGTPPMWITLAHWDIDKNVRKSVHFLNMTQVISVTEARKNLLKLVDQVDEEYTRVDLTKNGKVKATLVSPDYLDSIEETLYSLEHSLKDIREAEKRIAKGEYVTLEQVEEDLKKRLKRSKGHVR